MPHERRTDYAEIEAYLAKMEFFISQVRRVMNDRKPLTETLMQSAVPRRVLTHDSSAGLPCCDEPPSREAV